MEKLQKNDLITCPHCHTEIALWVGEAMPGMILLSKHFNFKEGMEVVNMEPMACKKCGDSWFDVRGLIHTSEGWKGA